MTDPSGRIVHSTSSDSYYEDDELDDEGFWWDYDQENHDGWTTSN